MRHGASGTFVDSGEPTSKIVESEPSSSVLGGESGREHFPYKYTLHDLSQGVACASQ